MAAGTMENYQGLIAESRACANLALFAREMASVSNSHENTRISALLAEMEDIFRPLINVAGRHGEDRSCALFDYGIHSGIFETRLHPGVKASRNEYPLPTGRADRLLEHEDGSFTVVEIKPSGSRRDIAQGLGQSILYASSMRAMLNDNRDVRPALFVSADHDPEISAACKMAGVIYLCFPRSAQKLVDALAETHIKAG